VVKTLDKLNETGLLDATLIVNMADHGEVGLSHGLGGMGGKMSPRGA